MTVLLIVLSYLVLSVFVTLFLARFIAVGSAEPACLTKAREEAKSETGVQF